MPKILLVAALKDEIREIGPKIAWDAVLHFKPAVLRRGQFEGKPVDLLVTGIGRKNARRAMAFALEQCKPELLLHVGYVGGASPVVDVGSLILARELVEEEGKEGVASEQALLEKGKKIADAEQLSFQIGSIVTFSRVVHEPHEKADVGARNKAIGIDMEGYDVGQAAREARIPFLAAKAVLDRVDVPLPHFEQGLDEAGEIRPVKFMGRMLHSPGELMQIPAFRYNAKQARNTVTRFVFAWLRSP